ncbi:MAG: hypothetical protein NVS4B3_08470 [Gemmatimonadaceae bacterium]
MSPIAEFLYPYPAARRGWFSRLNWWESRRLPYNVIVGAAGLGSLAVLVAVTVVPPRLPHMLPDWRLIVAYGVIANAAYTLGFVTESTLRAWWPEAPEVAPTLFREGLLLSVGLSILPGLGAAGLWLVHALTGALTAVAL